MIRFVCAVAVAAFLLPTAANAFPQFQKQWYEIYLKGNEDKKFTKTVRKEVKCFLCHQGKKKSNHNAYGVHFVGKLGKKDKKDVEKIVKVIKEVGKLHSDPKDKKSPTYDEMIAKSKLPGGELKDVKKEPAKKSKKTEKKED